jgi:hypothetical protein
VITWNGLRLRRRGAPSAARLSGLKDATFDPQRWRSRDINASVAGALGMTPLVDLLDPTSD